jgi:hypothetical protein
MLPIRPGCSMHVKERRRLKSRESPDGGTALVEFSKFTPTLRTRVQMSCNDGHLNRCKLTIKVRGELFTQMIPWEQIRRGVEHGQHSHGPANTLQATELRDRGFIGFKGNDNLIEFGWRQSAVEVARQQHRQMLAHRSHTGHVSSPLNMERPLWILDRTVPTGTSAASAISS